MTAPAIPPEALDESHYRRALGDFCDARVVSAHDAIYAVNGTKLIEKGARIDRNLYDRLLQHRLSESIDQHMAVEGMLGLPELETMARGLCTSAPLPRRMAARLGTPDPMVLPLRAVPLPAPVALKLTLMRDQHPALLQQGLQALLVALYLGTRLKLPAAQMQSLAAASLLRDLGMLHMDQVWLQAQRTMADAERRHLRAHPITSMILLRAQKVYAEDAVTAVFEHHERLDGSGYPRGAKAADISPLGQVLLSAELVAAMAHKFGEASPHHLALVLQLNQRAFPKVLTAELLGLLQDAIPVASAGDAELAAHQLRLLAEAFEQWADWKAALPTGPGDSPAHWMAARMAGLRQILIEAGTHPDQPAYLLDQGGGDDQQVAEAVVMGREALWQLTSICRECLQRWPHLAAAGGAAAPARKGDAAVAAWCAWVQQRLSGAAPAAAVAAGLRADGSGSGEPAL
ncbi:HD-GYP domain-containing protein [Xylophilus ampelinus]|uniref:HD domain-containing protein n=1 Tax=Xylophilus ampelinus TaxID=54067 RepID=A0A318SH11_9BURK|nr:HD domain-containing phosphohydrolase [Xylophilus ampelinus]MCS4510255.1 phosphohydrolase [Xylophilus ampelinus]PYE78124.1 HD domain-containing protein [Xylophilus ampelinus]